MTTVDGADDEVSRSFNLSKYKYASSLLEFPVLWALLHGSLSMQTTTKTSIKMADTARPTTTPNVIGEPSDEWLSGFVSDVVLICGIGRVSEMQKKK